MIICFSVTIPEDVFHPDSHSQAHNQLCTADEIYSPQGGTQIAFVSITAERGLQFVCKLTEGVENLPV